MISATLSALIFAVFLQVFRKVGLLDNPGPYWHNRAPVPLGFGILLYGNFLLMSLLCVALGYAEFSEKLVILLSLWAGVTLVSFFDDLDTIYKFSKDEKLKLRTSAEELAQVRVTKFAISPKWRLALQILVGVIVGLTSIKISYVSNIFWGILQLDIFSFSVNGFDVFLIPLAFTVIWYVLVFNSINWSDGVPGLTIGLATITLMVIAVLTVRFYINDETPALRENSHFVFLILSIVLPSALVAWKYNVQPKMLLGDSGTMFLAFIIASLALLVGGKVATVATALGVYLIDAIYVIVARILNKKNPLKWDRIHHLHYRLRSLWMSDSFIRRLVYLLAFSFGMSAAFLDRTGKILLFFVLTILIVWMTKIISLKK
jgi:UDP-GlcNAc:undecaprenyl-phosphate/decaprenyl-phosphate GlcNAc-1-phosphate transferase